jgi:riboflavin kinase/FMN adenylyltransferase
VEQISVQEINDMSVSSTKIRNVSEGNMTLANKYLGYDIFNGDRFKGQQLGRIPTNL